MHAAPAAVQATRPDRPLTVEEWLAIPAEKGAQLIHGAIVYDSALGLHHGAAKGSVFAQLRPYQRRREIGGWWLSFGVDMLIGCIGCRPDVVGWRRDKHARVPERDARGVDLAGLDFG